MNEAINKLNGWGQCPPGQLAKLVTQQQLRRRVQKIRSVGAAAAVVLVVGVTATLVISNWPRQQFEFGGITCVEAQSLLPQFTAGKLDAKTAAQVEAHLAECPHCGPRYREMMAEDGRVARSDGASREAISADVEDFWPACGDHH